MITIILIAVVYAIIRSVHDSFIRQGKWKLWAFIEGVFFAGMVNSLIHTDILSIGLGMILFAFSFWIVFDIFTGVIFGGHPLYIGNTGFDAKIRKVFQYSEKLKGTYYLIWKLFWYLGAISFYDGFAK